jgi:dienelactone hydrolase
MLVVCPQLEKRRRWSGQDAEWVDDLLTATIAAEGGDAGRIILTGFSYGGEGVFILGEAVERPWAALWAVDPAVDGERAPATPRPRPERRVAVHHGFDRRHVTEAALRSFLDACGLVAGSQTPVRRLTVLNTNHPATCVEAYRDTATWRWLLA